jgi:hypothetical protein
VAALQGEEYHAAVPESAAPLPGAIAIQSATGRAGK